MIRNKPSIRLYHNFAKNELLKELCAGMEEEGVPYELIESVESQIDTLCFEAAKDSILGVGIGLIGERVAIHMSPLPKEKPLFIVSQSTLKQARILGMNAARAVKRMPFKSV
jgi:hypothetical protein